MGYEKYDRLVRAAVAGQLAPDEQVEVVATSTVKQVTAQRMIKTAATAAVLSGGMLMVAVVPRKYFVVLTDRRMIFLVGNDMSGRPTEKIFLELPREALSVQSYKAKRAVLVIPTALLEVAVAGWDKALWMMFPTPCRDRAADIARALGAQV